MVPFYPFVPRIIWPSKPVLNKGQRLAISLGAGSRTATALTYPGDLYLRFGVVGVMVGMFAFGVVAQWLVNTVRCSNQSAAVARYVGMFVLSGNMETEVFAFWSGFIRWFVIISIVIWVVYGPRVQQRVRRPSG